MGRLFTSGYELNSTTARMEWDAFGGGTISSSSPISGTYSFRAQASGQYSYRTIATMAAGRTYYARIAIRIHTALSGAEFAGGMCDSALTNFGCWLRMNTDRTLTLMNTSNAAVGSNSAALTLDTAYYVEIAYTYTGGAVSANLNGTQFASGTSTASVAVAVIVAGLGVTASVSGDVYFDDVAVNDDQGGSQNTFPGNGKVICLRPSGTGDSASWTRAGTDSGANWSQCNNIPPNDATSYVLTSAGVNTTDMYAFGNSGIGASDTVNVVEVSCRCACSATTSPGFKLQIEKTTGGTKTQSAEITPNSTTWRTNTSTTTGAYPSPIISYTDPDGAAWTQSTLDSMQAGMVETTDTNRNIYVSDIWVIVDYTPSGVTINYVGGTVSSTTAASNTQVRLYMKTGGSVSSGTRAAGGLKLSFKLGGVISSATSLVSRLKLLFKLSGSVVSHTAVTAMTKLGHFFGGTVRSSTSLIGALRQYFHLGGNIQSGTSLVGDITDITAAIIRYVGGVIQSSTSMAANFQRLATDYIGGIIACSTYLSGNIQRGLKFNGAIQSRTAVSGMVKRIFSLNGLITCATYVTGSLEKFSTWLIGGTIACSTYVTGNFKNIGTKFIGGVIGCATYVYMGFVGPVSGALGRHFINWRKFYNALKQHLHIKE